MILIILLLLTCHFLGDFTPLSNGWMQKAKHYGKPFTPILAHAAVHASLMGIVLTFFVPFVLVIKLFLLQLSVHFLIDTLKGRLNGWFPILEDNKKKEYWMIFGLDQLLHQLTILLMVSIIY